MQHKRKRFNLLIQKGLVALVFIIIASGWNGCVQGNPDELSDSNKLLSLFIVLPDSAGTLNSTLLSTDDQGDANIDQFTINSNSVSYNVDINYSYMKLDSIQSEVAIDNTFIPKTLIAKWNRVFASSLYAHTTTIPVNQDATIYTAASGAEINNFHVSNTTMVTGSAFRSDTYTFTSVGEGDVGLMRWHVSELILGGTITNGSTKSFEIRLPAFDIELSPTCSTSITNGSNSTMYTVFKMHNLLKDTTDPTYGHVLDQIFNSGLSNINALSNVEFTNVILTNTAKSFLFYGCTL